MPRHLRLCGDRWLQVQIETAGIFVVVVWQIGFLTHVTQLGENRADELTTLDQRQNEAASH